MQPKKQPFWFVAILSTLTLITVWSVEGYADSRDQFLELAQAPTARSAVDQLDDIDMAGQIRGNVKCFDGSVPGKAVVYTPGDSFLVKTDENGDFFIRYIPFGAYDLRIESFGQDRTPLTPVDNIAVNQRQVTNVGTIVVACPEVCDGVDNNGDNQVDEDLDCGDEATVTNADNGQRGGGGGRGQR